MVRLFDFAGGSGHSAEAVIFFVDSVLRDVDLVYGLGRRVDNVGPNGCLTYTEPILVDVLYELAALVNADFGVPFCHFFLSLYWIGCFCFWHSCVI